jgi:transposase
MGNFKGNKTNMLTFEEKLEVAKDCMQNQQSWHQLGDKYNVSYSAARKWALGYEQYGEEYLRKVSSRVGQKSGQPKNNQYRINSIDPKNKKIAELKKRNKELEMENEILKKFHGFLKDTERKKLQSMNIFTRYVKLIQLPDLLRF